MSGCSVPRWKIGAARKHHSRPRAWLYCGVDPSASCHFRLQSVVPVDALRMAVLRLCAAAATA
ncbi:MAG: hypothetical protein JNM07_13880 [Phycisphaerae bacterium]|nr:hypothetical protein [Phycisphaerae bacterium]